VGVDFCCDATSPKASDLSLAPCRVRQISVLGFEFDMGWFELGDGAVCNKGIVVIVHSLFLYGIIYTVLKSKEKEALNFFRASRVNS
tara:strand:- start:79 stop:339 length:261 start_codon:yes stop_codon:yes gene_type:complete